MTINDSELLLLQYSVDTSIKAIEGFYGTTKLTDEHILTVDSLRTLSKKLGKLA